MEKVQNSIKGKMSGKDALGIEESLNKIKQLQERLKIMRDRGFSSPKEISEYNKLMDQLINQATDVQSVFKRIHLTGLDKEVSKIESELNKARNKANELERSFINLVSKGLEKGVKNTEQFKAELKQSLQTSESLEKVHSNIAKSLQKEIKEQKEIIKNNQKEVEQYSYNSQISRVSSQSFSIVKGKESKVPAGNNAIMEAVKATYRDILTKKDMDPTTAYQQFTKKLKDTYGLELKPNSMAIEKFKQAFNNAFSDGINQAKKLQIELENSKEKLSNLEKTAENINNIFQSSAVQNLFEQYKKGNITIEELTQKLIKAQDEAAKRELPESILETGQELDNAAKKSQELQTSLNDVSSQQVQFDSLTDSVGNFIKRILSVTTAYQTLRRVIRSTFDDIKNLDKAFGDIAMVTSYSVSDMWQQYGTYAEMANRLGQTTQSVIEASGLYYQQGLKTAEVMKLTEDTMKLATLAGLDFKEATSQMTGALRAFHMEMNQGAHVTDVYASIAANAAVDVNGISEAMSATAAIAHSAGMSFENTSAMLATMVEATQEAPKNLGTAMKAIIARFTELKTNVAGTAESEFDDLDYNKVDKALKSVGISIKDAAGQFRNLDEVFLELSAKWNSLERNTQRYIATIAAGSRQQSRFIALMENYDRTMELIQVAQESAGKADQQFAKYSDTIEFKLNRLKNAWEQTKTTIFTSEFYGDLVDIITKLVEKLEGLDWGKLLIAIPIAIAAGREMGKNWALGFKSGAAFLKDQFSKIISKEGLTTEELSNKYIQSKGKYSETTGLNQTNLLHNMRPEIAVEKKIKNELDNQLNVLNDIDKKRSEINKKVQQAQKIYKSNDFEDGYERKQAKLEFEEAKRQQEEIEAQYNDAQEKYENISEGNTEDIKKFSQEANESFKQLKQKRADLWKSQAWSAFGSAAGMAAGTALTMSLMGTFNAKEIFTTIGIETGITALTQALSKNFAGAAASAGFAIASGVAALVSSRLEKRAEKQRELNDEVYRYKKIIEADEEAQKKLNDEYNKTNTAFEQQKELYDSFKDASETYEELSKKVLLTEEEQEKLNEATAELIKLHPELVIGYNSQGKAILAMGNAWETVKNSEEAFYNSLRQERAEAEAEALKGQYKIASDYYTLDSRKKLQREQLYNGNAYGIMDSFWQVALSGPKYLNIKDLLQFQWDKGAGGNAYISAKNWVEPFAKQYSEFEEEFITAVNNVTDSHTSTINDAIDKIDDSDDKENTWYKVIQKIEEDFKLWEELDVDKLDDSQILQVAQNYQGAISNNLNILLGEFKGTENAKKQLIATLIQSSASTDQIKDILKQDSSKNAWDIAKDILGDNEELKTEYEELTDYQLELISNYISNLGKVSIEESEKEIEKLKLNNIGDKVIEALTDKLNDTEEQGEKIREKIGKIFGYGFDQSYLNQMFLKLAPAVQESLSKVLGNYSNAQASFILQGVESFLRDFGSSLDSDIFSYLAGIDWKNISLLDLSKTEKEFLDFAATVNVSTEQAKHYWNSYKQYMITTGAIDLAKSVNAPALADTIEQKLVDALKEKDNITKAITSYLENGFLNFTESKELEEACKNLGLKVEDYLTKNSKGYSLDIFKLQRDINNSFSYENLVKQAEKIADEEAEQLNLAADQLEAQAKQLDGEESKLKILKAQTEELGNQAALQYLLTHSDVESIQVAKDQLGIIESVTFKNDGVSAQDLRDLAQQAREQATELANRTGEKWANIFKDISEKVSSASYEMNNAITKAIKDGEDKLKQYQEDLNKAEEDVDNQIEELKKRIKDVEKAQKALYESKYGTENYKSNLDPLNNYTTLLDDITRKANKAKEALDDLQPGDNIAQLISTYANEVHSGVVTRTAENEVIKKSIQEAEKVLAEYSEYWYKIGDSYMLNIEKINNAKLPDALKDEIGNQITQLRNWQKQLYDNTDAIEKIEKEFRESRQKALQSYVSLEKEVIETLREQYEKEVNDLKDKYDAMSTADEDYLNSLEKAINKERDLRNRQNEWDDLATKEKRLSLMQRDTSGANQLEVQKLQQEVEKDRTQLLDNTVDDIVDSLKEMYDLQKESREAEIEYMNSMLDNAELIKQANEIISNWQSSADAVNWFMKAKDLNAMSAAELELEKENWEKLYKAKELYDEQSKIKFNEYLQTTQEEINKQLQTISETATTEAKINMKIVKDKIQEAQDAALETYNSAIKTQQQAEETLKKMTQTLIELQSHIGEAQQTIIDLSLARIRQMFDILNSLGFSSGANNTTNSNNNNSTLPQSYTSTITTPQSSNNASHYSTESVINGNSYLPTSEQNKIQIQQKIPILDVFLQEYLGVNIDEAKKKINQNDPSTDNWIIDEQDIKGYFNSISDFINVLSNQGIHGTVKTYNNNSSIVYLGMSQSRFSNLISKDTKKFATGGLVDYTGPAWVDGSPSRPEAFLSVDDTRLIGNLVNLLSDLPALNPNTTPSSISTSNIGDTTINLTVNFDSVSEDYDVERVVDIMKEKIVEAANYTGANVILNKR